MRLVLVCDILDEVSGSWYTGALIVMFKEGAFELSSPIRHSTELANVIDERAQDKPVEFIYSGGGPDLRVTHRVGTVDRRRYDSQQKRTICDTRGSYPSI
jgi:hypothetical protein